MSSLEQTLTRDFTQALKSRDELKISTLRLLKSSLDKIKKLSKSSQDISDEEIIKVIKQEVKKRKEAIEGFKKGHREELAKKEAAEMVILKVYLPPELPKEEIETVVKKIVSENNLTQADFGQAMKMVIEELKGQGDGKVVAELVKQMLGGEDS